MSRKVLMWGLRVVIFGMYWAMFASMTSWWVGLIIATAIIILQDVFLHAVNKVKLESDDKS